MGITDKEPEANLHDEQNSLLAKLSNLSDELQEIKRSLEHKVDERTQQLEQAKKQWERTFDAIDEPLLLIDAHYKIVRANLALERHAQEDIRHLIGQPCYQVMMERETPCENCPLQETLQTEKGIERELHHISKKRIYHLRSFPMSQSPPLAVHDYRDITEQKALQRQMMLADKLTSIGMLAGGVAHEINNPIAIILAQTQLLLMDVEPENTFLFNALKDIEKAALRCRKIVKDLLNFSRQAPTDQYEEQDLNQIIRQTLELYDLLPSKNSPPISLELQANLPSFKMDKEKMQSVLLNLLINARDATEADGHIIITTRRQENKILLSVSDDGMGMSEELKANAFMPFYTTKKRGLGTGLGLYIVQEVVKEHGGTIELHSEEGKGTRFDILLPIV